MRAAMLIALILVTGCTESFLPAWAVTNLRAVAAPVVVEGKPGRARPDPEDGVEVSVLMVDNGTPPPLQWWFIACVPAPTLIGPPICQDQIQPCEGCVGTPPADPLEFPVLRFQVPSETELEGAGADRVLLQGAVCGGGPPAADAILRFILGETDDLNPCEDPSNEGRFVTVNIPIESTPEDPNLNPEVSAVFLNGRPWPPPYDQEVPRTAPQTGCKADLDGLTDEQRAAHPLAGSAASTIDLGVTGESLQSYTVGDMTLIEEIQVSWLTDSGDLERTFSFITDPARSVLTLWQPPRDAPEDGLLVRLTFVIRDGRGGSDWVQRGLCVLPPAPDASPP